MYAWVFREISSFWLSSRMLKTRLMWTPGGRVIRDGLIVAQLVKEIRKWAGTRGCLPVGDEGEDETNERYAAPKDHDQGQGAFLRHLLGRESPGQVWKSVHPRCVEVLHPGAAITSWNSEARSQKTRSGIRVPWVTPRPPWEADSKRRVDKWP